MMDELEQKGQPRQTELLNAMKENSDKSDKILELLQSRDSTKLNEIIELLTSLNLYHGNPDSHKGFLQDLYEVTKCEKKETKKHRNAGLIIAVLVTIAALVAESLNKGESSIFVIALKFVKGVVL